MHMKGWLSAVLLGLILLLSGCGDAPAPTTPATPTGTPPSDARFALAEATSEPWEGRAALLLRFTRPLAGAQPFDSLLRVSGPNGAAPESTWVLDGEGHILRLPYVEANQTYTVTLDAALAAADGSTLGEAVAREIHSGNLPPQVGFASQGSVLPARNSDGLPLITLNVAEVDVEFLRVRPKSLSQFFAQHQSNGQRSIWDLQQLAGFTDSVYANRFALDGRPNERSVAYLPVQSIPELREPGVYFAVLRRAGGFDYQHDTALFFVSDLGLHLRLVDGTLWLHAASLTDGLPLSGVQVEVLDKQGNAVLQATTGSDGHLQTPYVRHIDHVLVARRGTDVSYISLRQPALDLSDFRIEGRASSPLDAYLWSGRDLYRPGETLQVSALLRDADGRLPGTPQPLFLALRQPDGQRIAGARIEPGPLGYHAWSHALPADAPTGRWTLEARTVPDDTAAPVARMTLRIEEFLPERLKLVLDSRKAALATGDALPLAVDADYLYGAPAAGNRFVAELSYRPGLEIVPSLPGYRFGDPGIELPKESVSVIDEALPDSGVLERDIPLLEGAPPPKAPVQVSVVGAVYESGGRAVRRILHRVLWPAPALVGIRPRFEISEGAPANGFANFELVRSDADGALSAASGLKLRLQRERRDYRWTWIDGGGWRADHTSTWELIEERTLDLDGRAPATVELRVQWGEYRLEVEDPQTGLVTRLPFVAGWSWNDDNRGPDARPDKVKLALDKTGYAAGDVLKLTLTPPQDGRGVVLVEHGNGQLYSANLDIRAGMTVEIPVTPAWERHDVYITALVLANRSGERAGPTRALGVTHVPMDRAARRVDVALEAPALARPGEPLEIVLRAPALAGHEAYVATEAVDRGILSLTGYALPDAAAYFFAPRRLAVEAYDLYGRVIEALAGSRARLRYGGDAELAALPQARRPTARVQTVALHHGPVAFDANGEARVRFTAPDFNGALRIAALAWSAEHFGHAEGESIVRAPLVVEASSPRVMAPGDRAQLSIDLQNLSGRAARYRVQASATAPLQVDGGAQTVELADGERRTLSLPLRAGDGSTAATVTVDVDGDAQLRRSHELVVRPAWAGERRGDAVLLQPGESHGLGAELLRGLMPDTAQVQLSLASQPPLPITAAARALADYPYGCAEQTTSKLWPLVLLDEARARALQLPWDGTRRAALLDTGFGRLTAMQTDAGHFAFWPGEGWAEPRLTPYIADLLLAAREAGLDPPAAVLDKALKRLGEDLLTGGNGFHDHNHSDHLRFANQAYAAYVLARAGQAPLGTLRALFDHERGKALTAVPLLHLALALELQGDAPRAQQALDAALAFEGERPEWLPDYGSALVDQATVLALLARHGHLDRADAQRLMTLAREARADLRFGRTTQENVALLRLGTALGHGHATLDGELVIGGAAQALGGMLDVRTLSPAELRQGVRLRAGSQPLFVGIDVAGTPTAAPAPRDDGLRITRAWYRPDGSLFTGGALKEGDSLIVKLSVEAEETVPDALVVDLVPGGLEVENLNLADNDQINALVLDGQSLSERRWAAEIRHEEYRDDRYVAAIRLWGGGTAQLFYVLRAVSPGSYVVPPPSVEDMYRPRIGSVGRAVPERIEVRAP